MQFVLERLNERGARAKLTYTRRIIAVPGEYTIYFATKSTRGKIEIDEPYHPLLAGMLQPILDEYISKNQRSKIDYIHGDKEFEELCTYYDTVGFSLNAMDKETFFDTVKLCGVLPKKTFSLGEAEEKRYYLEGRLISKLPDPEPPVQIEEQVSLHGNPGDYQSSEFEDEFDEYVDEYAREIADEYDYVDEDEFADEGEFVDENEFVKEEEQ